MLMKQETLIQVRPFLRSSFSAPYLMDGAFDRLRFQEFGAIRHGSHTMMPRSISFLVVVAQIPSRSAGEFKPNERGVNCEACHGPGQEHRRAGGKAAIRNPRNLSAIELNDACGRCHRHPPSDAARFDWDNPWNVRFGPVYLNQSACFKRSGGRLSCLSCHASHKALRKNDPVFYNGVCSSCHVAAHRNSNKTDCIGCHMPRVLPRPPLWFTNHWIGAYGSTKLKPAIKAST
jgi:hypothetical protein